MLSRSFCRRRFNYAVYIRITNDDIDVVVIASRTTRQQSPPTRFSLSFRSLSSLQSLCIPSFCLLRSPRLLSVSSCPSHTLHAIRNWFTRAVCILYTPNTASHHIHTYKSYRISSQVSQPANIPSNISHLQLPLAMAHLEFVYLFIRSLSHHCCRCVSCLLQLKVNIFTRAV